MPITKKQWEIDRYKGKHKLLFDELSKDLHNILYTHEFNVFNNQENSILALELQRAMKRYGDKFDDLWSTGKYGVDRRIK